MFCTAVACKHLVCAREWAFTHFPKQMIFLYSYACGILKVLKDVISDKDIVKEIHRFTLILILSNLTLHVKWWLLKVKIKDENHSFRANFSLI